VRAVVITGAGRGFCAGQDLGDPAMTGDVDVGSVIERYYRPLATRVRSMPVPVLAAVNGVAAGAGANFALCCDMVIASEDAKFGLAEIKIGVIPGAGATIRLPRWVGKAKAMDLALTGRMMDAAEAERAGLVSRVVPLDKLMEEALGAALLISEFSQVAVMAVKESVNRSFEGTLNEGIMFERRLFHALFATSDQKEGMDAFVNKRKAVFTHQ